MKCTYDVISHHKIHNSCLSDCFTENSNRQMALKTDIIGGHTSYIAGLSLIDLEDPENNKQMYSKWAGSVKDLPKVIKQKVCKAR